VYCILLQNEDVQHEEEKQIVADAVHDFLQVLCTSHKYGIIFHDRSIGTSGKKHNELLQTVLEVSTLINTFLYLLLGVSKSRYMRHNSLVSGAAECGLVSWDCVSSRDWNFFIYISRIVFGSTKPLSSREFLCG
jgi:hypothetical protein